MSLEEAIRILTVHQVWRIGADIPMISPKELTEAIDVIINYHSKRNVDTNKTIISNDDIEKLAEEHVTKHHLNHSYNTSKFSFKEGIKHGQQLSNKLPI